MHVTHVWKQTHMGFLIYVLFMSFLSKELTKHPFHLICEFGIFHRTFGNLVIKLTSSSLCISFESSEERGILNIYKEG